MIKIDFEGSLTKKLSQIEKDVLPKAVKSSLNKTLTTLRAEVKTIVTKDEKLNLKASEVAKVISLGKAKGSRVSDIGGQIKIEQKATPLIKFMNNRASYGRGIKTNKRSGKIKRQAVKVRVRKGGPAKVVRGAFVSSMKSGHTGIFKRVGTGRLPIRELFSTSVRDLFRKDSTIDRLKGVARERYGKALREDLRFFSTKKI